MTEKDYESDHGVVTEKRVKTKKPRPYNVILWNDDYTTQEFVVMLLEQIFHHSPSAATQIMLHIHTRGKGVAGTFTRDIAESKAARAVGLAREAGHPLKCTTERT